MPSIDFAAIKREVTMPDVLRLIGWLPTWTRGDQQRGPCPIHGSTRIRSRSFCVNADGWYCHKCRNCGDQITLFAEVKRLSVYDAAREVCRLLGRPVYYLPRKTRYEKSGNGEEER